MGKIGALFCLLALNCSRSSDHGHEGENQSYSRDEDGLEMDDGSVSPSNGSSSLVLDAPSPANFFEAATQTHPLYPPFQGYDDLQEQSDLVVVGRPAELLPGAVWIFEGGHRNSTVMRFSVSEVVEGVAVEETYISFETGITHGHYADVPEGIYRAYLTPVSWIDNPEFDEPLRSVPEGETPYTVVRPEGLVLEVDGEFADAPLTKDYPVGPSVHGFEADDSVTPSEDRVSEEPTPR